ncbi:MAG: GAF domain-containing protein [Methylococcales bacterium]|nr:GAF domain-containing protein [Methylococcales bacterium]
MSSEERCAFLEERIKRLNDIGLALSREDDTDVIFELIIEEARNITHAEGRTLYMRSDDGRFMNFEILRNDAMKTVMGGTSSVQISFPPVGLFDPSGEPNLSNVVSYVTHSGKTVNIEDAYREPGYDFSGTKAYDQKTGYRSKSFLAIPLKDHEDEIIGVIQLLNSIDQDTGEVRPFSADMEQQVEALASQGAVVLTNKGLIAEFKNLFEAFIKLIATAIDKKSPYTGGHCARVPEIAMMLADAVEKTTTGKYRDFSMTEEQRYEFYMAAWLHDCGKVATPVHIVDKAMKLETISDRIEVIDSRFELLKRDAEIDMLKGKIRQLEEDDSSDRGSHLESEYQSRILQLDEDRAFIRRSNRGGEFMEESDQHRVAEIARYNLKSDGRPVPFLDKDDVRNLQIQKGTLLPEERTIINDHIVITIEMLEKLPYPKNLRNIPEFAGGHHEKINGTGYPRGLKGHEMSTQTKIMAITEIYEALTAPDRPYKDGKKLSSCMKIMGFMKDNNEIDKDLFEIFIKEGVYKKYAEQFVDRAQIDEVDEARVLGSTNDS